MSEPQVLTVALGERSYPIHIGSGLFKQLAALLRPHLNGHKSVIVTNTTVGPLYAGTLTAALEQLGQSALVVTLPDGEEYKSAAQLDEVYTRLLEARCDRKTTLVALGGGVIGDLTGFAAATFMRGVPFIQVPTTLLAQVDSSVGGKTAINHPLGKNMIGAFYQPKAVIADMDSLTTLPDRELKAGLAEVIKYGVIDDLPFFEWLEQHIDALVARDSVKLAEAVAWSCRNKARIVAADETEQGVRALLNLGHTFGHAIEAGLGYGEWLHGEAVAAGMVLAAKASHRMGWLSADAERRIISLIGRAGLPIQAPDLGTSRYLELMQVDKKNEAGRIRFVMVRAIGESFVTSDVSPAVLEAVLSAT